MIKAGLRHLASEVGLQSSKGTERPLTGSIDRLAMHRDACNRTES